jgi:hypothetical protein
VNISSSRQILRASLKTQCYRDYFYGEDGQQEKLLADIEGIAATALKKVVLSESLPGQANSDFSTILTYLLLQNSRTGYHIDALNEMADSFMKHAIRPYFNQQFPEGDLEKFVITLTGATHMAISSALNGYILLLDMQWLLLKAPTGNEFITSDTPVVRANPFLQDLMKGGGAGIANKGLQILLPLTPNLAILLFDKQTYRTHGIRGTELVTVTAKDLEMLNVLQCAACYENVYFNDPSLKLEALAQKARPFRRAKKHTTEVHVREDTEERRRELILLNQVPVKAPLTFSFLAVRKEAVRWKAEYSRLKMKPAVAIRTPFLSKIYDEYHQRIEEGYELPEIGEYLQIRFEQEKPDI